MNMDLLYLLPALAVLICLTGAVFAPPKSGYVRAGREWRRYSRGTVITARFTVAALLIGTVITLWKPVPGVQSLFQGLVITFVCLMPLIAYHLFTTVGQTFFGKPKKSKRKRRTPNYRRADSPASDDFDKTIDISQLTELDPSVTRPVPAMRESKQALSPTARSSAERAQPSTGDRIRAESAGIAPTAARAPAQRLQSEALEPVTRRPGNNPGPSSASKPADNSDVQEQMDRVSTLVKSYDLGDDEEEELTRPAVTANRSPTGSRSLRSRSLAGKTQQSHPTELASHNEQALQVSKSEALRKVIATLQDDKRKLQRLVIAQQAAFDSERQSHERTRHVARDAIKVMRDARSGQRMAEKIARRERAERRRLEKEYTKVTRALKNAMSTLANTKDTNGNDSTSAA